MNGSEQTPPPRRSGAGAPPYAKYAFVNPYNLSLLAGAGLTAAATGQWWLALCAAASEAIWMLFAPESSFLQRAFFDKRWAESQDEQRRVRQAEKYAQLSLADQQRALVLREQQRRIHQLAAENPTFNVELLRADLGKLEGLVDDFLDMAVSCNRWERHLGTFDLDELERSLGRYEDVVRQLPASDERHEVAKRNLEVLRHRKVRWEELLRNLQTTRGQMDLLENTFRLLADDIVAMRNPSELGERLDDVRVGVEAIRETSCEAEQYVQAELEARRAAGG